MEAPPSAAQVDIDPECVKTVSHCKNPTKDRSPVSKGSSNLISFLCPNKRPWAWPPHRTSLVFLPGGTNLERQSSILLIAQEKKLAPVQRYLLQEQLTITLGSYAQFFVIMIEENLGMRSCR